MHTPPMLLSGIVHSKVPMGPYSTMGIGGPARYLCAVDSQEDLSILLHWAHERALPWIVAGECSNILFSDKGVDGLVILNRLSGVARKDGSQVLVGSGENLGKLILWLNQNGLQGMEKMYGIPGTIAGAVVGNAGAYGQEICQTLKEATLIKVSGDLEVVPAEAMGFKYRHSRLKKDRGSVLVECRLELSPDVEHLQKESDAILKKRSIKYPPGLKCPGSFFKNIEVSSLDSDQRSRIPASFFYNGKVPAGKLLDTVGAKGARKGEAMIASYHANLILNCGRCSSADVLWLARTYANRVLDRYGIILEPEIRILNEGLEEEK